MRAIAAIVTGFLLLAAVQAGYMLVEAHRSHRGLLESRGEEQHIDTHLAPQKLTVERRRYRKHKQEQPETGAATNSTKVMTAALRGDDPTAIKPKPKPKPDQDYSTKDKVYTRKDTKKSQRNRDGERKHRRKDNGRIDDSSSRDHRKERKHRKPKSPHHGKPVNVYVPGTARNQSDVEQLLQVAIEPPVIATSAPSIEQNENDPFLTAKPTKDGIHKSKPKSENKHRDNAAIVRKQGKYLSPEEKAEIRRYHRARWGNRRARKDHRKLHRACESIDDCAHGECCLERKLGQKYCFPGGTKAEGKHCMDMCMCKPGLQCYAHTTSKNKKIAITKPSKPLGKCVNPDHVDITKGYLLPPPATTTAVPATEQP